MADVDNPLGRTAERRADELNGFFADPAVRAVMSTIGGYTTSGVLDLLDYSALRADPKVVIGYSDITALLGAVLEQAGIVVFHGPTVLPELAEHPGILPYTRKSLLRAVTRSAPVGPIVPATEWTEEFLSWDVDDDRPRTVRRGPGRVWLRPGTASGPLLGGNLDTLSAIAGTRYFPALDDAILLCETASGDIRTVIRALTHLRLLGAFDTVAGVVVARAFRAPAGFDAALATELRRLLVRPNVPVVVGVDAGHCDPMATLPLGVTVELDSTADRIEVLDAAVG